MPSTNFEPMSVGEIIDRTFKIYKSNFLRIVAIVAVIQIPLGLFQLGFTEIFMAETQENIQATATQHNTGNPYASAAFFTAEKRSPRPLPAGLSG